MSSKTLQCSHFNPPKFTSAIALENRTHHASEKLFWMLHLVQIFLLTRTVWATQVSDFYVARLIALHSEGRAPVTHATSCWAKTSTHVHMLVIQYLMPKILFQSWKGWSCESFQNSGGFGKLQLMHILLPSTALKMYLLVQVMYWIGLPQCAKEGLGTIQWDPSPP